MINGELTIGSYVAFSSYASTFTSSLQKLTSLNVSLQTTVISLDKIDEIMGQESENDNLGTKAVIGIKHIEIRDIYFSYDGINNVLNGLSLSVEENRSLAIVGPSGSGKSTLFKLIMKFYGINDGKIYLDGENIDNLDVNNLRKNITYVQQDPFLFDDTIKNNLLITNGNASDYRIEVACKEAFIHDFIMSLPEKYDTAVGENGSRLSGGQRQRLAVARGILNNSTIFLFDEITSDLDGEAEKYMMKMLRKLSENHIVLLIAHRQTTVIAMPRIVVLDAGQIVSEGTHKSLLQKCPVYRRLFSKSKRGVLAS